MMSSKTIHELSSTNLTLTELRQFMSNVSEVPGELIVQVTTYDGQRDTRTDGVRVVLKIEEAITS